MDSQSELDSLEEVDEVTPSATPKRRGRGRRGRGPAKPQTVPPTRPRRTKAAAEGSVSAPAAAEGSSSSQQEASGQDSSVNGSRETQGDPGITPQDMYKAVLYAKTAMVTVVDEWLDTYKEDREEGLWLLINFIVECCGCQGVVTRRMLDDMDNATIISRLTEDFAGPGSYPLGSAEGSKKNFKERLCEFVTVLVRSCESGLLYDDHLFSALLPLLISMSDSQVRAFRHTSTLMAMKLMTGIVAASVNVSARLQTTTHHYETEIDKPVHHQDLTKLENLQNTITQLKENLEELAAMTNSTFTGVFVNRYRDAVPEIRAICIQELGNWALRNPGAFLDIRYLKYLGWLLKDKESSVRLQCVRILQVLYRKKEFIGLLELFTSSFKDRILSMTLDEELDVSVEVMKLLLLIEQHTEEGLTDTESIPLYEFLFANNRRLAAGAGAIIYSIWKRKVACGDQDDTKVFFQFLVTFYQRSSMLQEHRYYLVDSMWGIPELRDWNTMTSLLLEEPDLLQYEDEAALIELMLCAIRQAAEAIPPAGREEGKKVLTKSDKQNQARDRIHITNHFIPVLPQLLAKYSADAKCVSRLLAVPLYFNLETYSTSTQLDRHLVLLLEQVCDIVVRYTDACVLDACASLFTRLCSEQYSFSTRSKTTVSRLLDYLTDRFNPSVHNLLEGTADEDEVYAAVTALTKIAGLSRSFNITRLQLLEPCLQLLKAGVKFTGVDKQLMVAALHTAAYHLIWMKSSAAVMQPKQAKRAVKSFYKVSEIYLISDQVEVRNKAFELLCDLLVLYSGYVVRTQPDLQMLSCSCPETLHVEMSGFLVDYIFSDPDDDRRDDESEELKILEWKRRLLGGYCKLILFGVLDLNAAANVFKYYNRFCNDFGDIIKLFLNKTKLIDPIESAKTVCLCLQQLFTELEPTESSGKEFQGITAEAKRHAMCLGVNLQSIKEQVLALHKQGIEFAFHDVEELEDGSQPPKLLFLEILSEFSYKVPRQNRANIIAVLKTKCSKTALRWPSVCMYLRSLSSSSITSPAQPKRKTPAVPEPSAPGLSSVTFPSIVDDTSSSPLPSILGDPVLSSTVVHTEPTKTSLGLDGNISDPEPEQDVTRGSQMRSVKTSTLQTDMSVLSLIEELVEDEEVEERTIEYFDTEDSPNKPSTQRTSTGSSFLEDLFM